jgi:hypothetical protein
MYMCVWLFALERYNLTLEYDALRKKFNIKQMTYNTHAAIFTGLN